jgi:hypothetical protein
MSDIWYYAVGDRRAGPLSLAELQDAIAHLDLDDVLVWGGDAADWKPARDAPELLGFQTAIPPPLPARRVSSGAEATQATSFVDDDGETKAAIAGSAPGKTLRMLDWIRAFKLVLFYVPLAGACCALAVFLIWAWVAQGHPDQDTRILFVIGFAIPAIAVLSLLAIIVHFIGYVFDPARRLTYPTYVFRRSIPISEITDANCETLIGHNPLGQAAVGLLVQSGSYGKPKPIQRTRPARIYVVDVSGEFGVRQMRFAAKYKRNQFLSNLRVVAPQCRITRWVWKRGNRDAKDRTCHKSAGLRSGVMPSRRNR